MECAVIVILYRFEYFFHLLFCRNYVCCDDGPDSVSAGTWAARRMVSECAYPASVVGIGLAYRSAVSSSCRSPGRSMWLSAITLLVLVGARQCQVALKVVPELLTRHHR
jgi:hypothetical protein